MKHAVLVGATDGIGLALAREYLGRGWRVAVVGRDADKLERVVAGLRDAFPASTVVGVPCDVTDPAAVGPAFEEVLRALGQMDLMVYCAGVMAPARTAGERLEGAAAMLEANALGAVHFLERGAEYLEPLGRGRLAALGSIAGVRGRGANPVYCASKAALHAYLEGLRHRLHPSGVGVSAVKPGFVRTRMLRPDAPGFPPAITAERAAVLIADGLERGRDDFFVPWWWALVAAALRALPVALHKRFAPA